MSSRAVSVSPLAAAGWLLVVLALLSMGRQVMSERAPSESRQVAAARAMGGAPDAEAVGALRRGEGLDLNRAGRAELMLLPRIGPALAERIVRDRAERGPFHEVDALTRVRGIGPRTVAALRPWVRVDPLIPNDSSSLGLP